MTKQKKSETRLLKTLMLINAVIPYACAQGDDEFRKLFYLPLTVFLRYFSFS